MDLSNYVVSVCSTLLFAAFKVISIRVDLCYWLAQFILFADCQGHMWQLTIWPEQLCCFHMALMTHDIYGLEWHHFQISRVINLYFVNIMFMFYALYNVFSCYTYFPGLYHVCFLTFRFMICLWHLFIRFCAFVVIYMSCRVLVQCYTSYGP